MSSKIKDLQTLLKFAGYDPGPLDGIWGRKSISATRAFQQAHGLLPDGIVGKMTLAALNSLPATAGLPTIAAPVLPWIAEAYRRAGLHEVRDKSKLWSWLRSDGTDLGDPEKLPWCGAFVETAIGLTLPDEPLPALPYLARSWAKFGMQLGSPMYGAIGVFWRGSANSPSGHVGFLVGRDESAFHVLGGNQSNAVTTARVSAGRLICATWPKSFNPPTRMLPRQTLQQSLSVNEA